MMFDPQVKSARQEVVQALASRREAEMQSDRLDLEIQRMRLFLEVNTALALIFLSSFYHEFGN